MNAGQLVIEADALTRRSRLRGGGECITSRHHRPPGGHREVDERARQATAPTRFVVAKDANKHEIARAIETLFNVKVKDVRTMQYRGKERRVGKHSGRRASWKKAVVTLAEGDTIQIFEGV
jgi:large subunit ribosomal protein L23